MSESTIEWTNATWNVSTGCNKISAGCKFCYAEMMSRRLKAMGQKKYQNGFGVLTTHEDTLKEPYKWEKPRMIFVNSMSDLFHEKMPFDFIQKVFEVMNDCSQHTFQVLTKRADILAKYAPFLNWTDNIWAGVSVENQEQADRRIPYLLQTPAKTKFLSCEPLLGAINFENTIHFEGQGSYDPDYQNTNYLTGEIHVSKYEPASEHDFADYKSAGIDWVIVGGESGRGEIRPMQEEWAVSIMEQCKAANVPFFFKQWGGTNKKKTGRELQGVIYSEMPKPVSERTK